MSSNKVEELRKALAEFQGGTLFDEEAEQAAAKVRKRALMLLDHRARSRHELKERLIRAEFDREVVDSVLDDLEQSGLINDAVFAHEWVRQRHERRGKSASVLAQELRDKGVGEVTVQDAISQIEEHDERRMAQTLAEKKASRLKVAPEGRGEYDKELRRIVGVLARRGFPQGMSIQVSKQALEQRLAELS